MKIMGIEIIPDEAVTPGDCFVVPAWAGQRLLEQGTFTEDDIKFFGHITNINTETSDGESK